MRLDLCHGPWPLFSVYVTLGRTVPRGSTPQVSGSKTETPTLWHFYRQWLVQRYPKYGITHLAVTSVVLVRLFLQFISSCFIIYLYTLWIQWDPTVFFRGTFSLQTNRDFYPHHIIYDKIYRQPLSHSFTDRKQYPLNLEVTCGRPTEVWLVGNERSKHSVPPTWFSH